MIDMDKWQLHIEFEAHPDWKPLDDACWFHCPLACLTHLSEVCAAKEAFDKDGINICPMSRYGKHIDNKTVVWLEEHYGGL